MSFILRNYKRIQLRCKAPFLYWNGAFKLNLGNTKGTNILKVRVKKGFLEIRRKYTYE